LLAAVVLLDGAEAFGAEAGELAAGAEAGAEAGVEAGAETEAVSATGLPPPLSSAE